MFIHPWLIVLGVLAAGLPVLVHWLTRPRPVTFALSTLRFVREVVEQRRARHRLRDFLVLALRTLAVLLLAAAIARPILRPRELAAVDEDADALRVVILDVSQSMAAQSRGVRAFERARPLALDHLEYRPGLKVNLIFAGARPSSLFQYPSTNFAALREGLADVAVRPERLNVQSALNLAADMLDAPGASESLQRELIVVSEFQRSNWADADFSALPENTSIRLESVATEQPPANVAIVDVNIRGRAEVGKEVRLEVEVGNYSSAPRQVRVEVDVDEAVYQLQGTCAANTRTTLFSRMLPRQVGWQAVEARLLDADDALPADNRRASVLEVRPPPVYALITRQSEKNIPSSSYFLERALGDTERQDGPRTSRVVRLEPGRLDPETVGPVELIVLDHPGPLSEEAIGDLASLLRRGRGVLYVAAEPVDATNLKRLTEAAGSGLDMPVEFSPPPAGQLRRNLFLTEVRSEGPPFDLFGDNLGALIGDLRFSGGLASRRLDAGLAEDVLATFNDRSVFLATTSSESGALTVLNADLGLSNLPTSPLFVPLLGELVQHHLLSRGRSTNVFACGEPMVLYLPAEAGAREGLQLAGPRDGYRLAGSAHDAQPTGPPGASPLAGVLSQESTGVVWQAETAGPPGVYQVKRGDTTVFAMATVVPAEESDLRTLPPDVFEQRMAGGREVRFRSAASAGRDEQDRLWIWLDVASIACLMGEVAALKVFRT